MRWEKALFAEFTSYEEATATLLFPENEIFYFFFFVGSIEIETKKRTGREVESGDPKGSTTFLSTSTYTDLQKTLALFTHYFSPYQLEGPPDIQFLPPPPSLLPRSIFYTALAAVGGRAKGV